LIYYITVSSAIKRRDFLSAYGSADGDVLEYYMIDTHCHLDMKEFDSDREEVIKRAREAGFEALITVGSDLQGTLKGMRLAEKHDFIYASVGIHPHDARDFTEGVYADLRQWSAGQKVVAIGETGLDYHYDHSPRETQKEVFRSHLRLAGEVGLPVIVHSREAAGDTLTILKESGIQRGVLHCFSGDREMAEKAMAMGFYLSVAGPVTFKKSLLLKEIVRLIPDDYILVETDAPYLAPEPFRGKRNEPAYMLSTLRHVADLRGVSLEDMARITSLNAKRLFAVGVIPEKAEIAYRIRDSLYLNITNRCTNACSFCVKFRSDFVKGHKLRLDCEPSEEDIKKAIGDPSAYKEVVFCGYGEPLQRLDTVKNVAGWVKRNGGRVRINTNGHANMIHKRNIVPELKGVVDSISISLDAQDESTYDSICRPFYPHAYQEVIRFIERAKEVIPDVQVTVVELGDVDVARCREIAEKLGVKFRLRKFDIVG
jgi:TatD DNase family protein